MDINTSQPESSQTQLSFEMIQMVRDKIENDFPNSIEFYKKMEEDLSSINSELDILLDKFEELRTEAFIDHIEWVQTYKNVYEMMINTQLQHKATEELLDKVYENIVKHSEKSIEMGNEEQEI